MARLLRSPGILNRTHRGIRAANSRGYRQAARDAVELLETLLKNRVEFPAECEIEQPVELERQYR